MNLTFVTWKIEKSVAPRAQPEQENFLSATQK